MATSTRSMRHSASSAKSSDSWCGEGRSIPGAYHRDREDIREGGTGGTEEAANSGKDWGPKEVAQLKMELRSNTPTRMIGHHLRRSPGAVQQKASSLGLSTKTTNKSPFGPEASVPALGEPRGRSSQNFSPPAGVGALANDRLVALASWTTQ